MHAPVPQAWPAGRHAQPTDQPVLRSNWSAQRYIHRGHYWLAKFDSRNTLVPSSRCTCVVDDFGDLVTLDPELEYANWLVWVSSERIEAATQDQFDRAAGVERAAQARLRGQRAFTSLAKPAPVVAMLEEQPAQYPLDAAVIHIGADQRAQDAILHMPTYRVLCDSQVMVLSHAQLAALMLAGQELCAAAHLADGQALQ